MGLDVEGRVWMVAVSYGWLMMRDVWLSCERKGKKRTYGTRRSGLMECIYGMMKNGGMMV